MLAFWFLPPPDSPVCAGQPRLHRRHRRHSRIIDVGNGSASKPIDAGDIVRPDSPKTAPVSGSVTAPLQFTDDALILLPIKTRSPRAMNSAPIYHCGPRR